MKWPRLLIGLLIVLISVAGLLAVSSLVPDVGCDDRPNNYLETYTSIKIQAPTEVNPGQSFSVNGTLYKILSFNRLEPFPRQEITINFAGADTVVYTDDSGHFTADFNLENPGIYRLVTAYAGDRLLYYVESKAEAYVTVTGPPIKPVDYRWLIYASVALEVLLIGYVIYLRYRDYRRTPAGQVPGSWRSFRKKPRRVRPWLVAFLSALIVFGIFFALWPRNQVPVRHGTEPEFIVTRIELNVPSHARPGLSFTIKGTLTATEGIQETPLPSQPIHIVISPEFGTSNEITSMTTDTDGRFSGDIILDKTGVFEVAAVFNDTANIYYESSDSRKVIVGNQPASPFSEWHEPGWLSIIIGTPLLVLLSLVVFLFWRRYRRNLHNGEKVQAKTSAKAIISPITATAETLKRDHRLQIDFPHIPPPLPDVWGRGDILEIVLRKIDESEQTTLTLELEPGWPQEFTFDDDGTITRDYIYGVTGSYDIKAVLVGETRCAASRFLRIVDYREEIVRLYNDLLVDLRSSGFNLPPRLTAREMQLRLCTAFPVLSDKLTNPMVNTFETANYSLHPISRPHYEIMYLAVQDILKLINPE
jgi:hypothetical protein